MVLTPEQELLLKVQAGVSVEKRTVYITGPVDAALAHRVLIALEVLDRDDGEIRIVLNSEGGEEQSGYAIHDAIAQCRNRVTIDGYGSVMSIAAAIFQAGDWRRLAYNAEFMIHNGTLDTDSSTIEQDVILDLAEQVRRGNYRYYTILMQGSQQPQDTIEEWCKEEKFFDAEEAVAAGFADEVIEPLKSKTPKKRRKRK